MELMLYRNVPAVVRGFLAMRGETSVIMIDRYLRIAFL